MGRIMFLDEDGNGQAEGEERLPDLPLLSEQLLLDELWDMLGECLKELEESHDQHAVLGQFQILDMTAPLTVSFWNLFKQVGFPSPSTCCGGVLPRACHRTRKQTSSEGHAGEPTVSH